MSCLRAVGEQKVLSTFSKIVQSRVKLWSPSAEGETLQTKTHYKKIVRGSKAVSVLWFVSTLAANADRFKELEMSFYHRKLPTGNFSGIATVNRKFVKTLFIAKGFHTFLTALDDKSVPPSAEGGQRRCLWTPQTFVYKSLTKNFIFCYNERSRRQATCARARLFNLHLTDNANCVPTELVQSTQPAYGRITSLPPMYILRGSGMRTEPSSLRLFSRNAISIRGGATTVLFRVCGR